MGRFPSPPPSQRALGTKSSRPRGARSSLSAILIDFLGYRFSTHFLMRFYIDFGSPNGVKIDQKSDFFVDCRWKCFFQVSSRFLSSFLHQPLDLRTSMFAILYDVFEGFFTFQKIASRTTSKWFLTSQKLQKTFQNRNWSPKLKKTASKNDMNFQWFFR